MWLYPRFRNGHRPRLLARRWLFPDRSLRSCVDFAAALVNHQQNAATHTVARSDKDTTVVAQDSRGAPPTHEQRHVNDQPTRHSPAANSSIRLIHLATRMLETRSNCRLLVGTCTTPLCRRRDIKRENAAQTEGSVSFPASLSVASLLFSRVAAGSFSVGSAATGNCPWGCRGYTLLSGVL